MKILHIYDDERGEKVSPDGGAVGSVAFYLAKYAAETGHEVTVLERVEGQSCVENKEGIRFVRLGMKRLARTSYEEFNSGLFGFIRFFLDRFKCSIKFYKFIKSETFDVIHVHLPFTVIFLLFFDKIDRKLKLREKIVYTAHVGEEKKKFRLGPQKEIPLLLKIFSPDLFLMKRVRKVVVLNKELKSKLITLGRAKTERLLVIPNPIDVSKFYYEDEKDSVKTKYGLCDKIIVMSAGAIILRKGVGYLVRAAETIIKELGFENVLFLLVGNLSLDREFADKVLEYVKSHNLEDSVKFTGFVPYEDLKALYAACDIFVFPSFEEGDPIALKEALASGKPLVGTNVGGIPMQIKDGWNGFLIEPANEKQLAEKIKYLVDNEKERIRMGKNSRKLAEEEFDWRKIGEEYIEVYERVSEGGELV